MPSDDRLMRGAIRGAMRPLENPARELPAARPMRPVPPPRNDDVDLYYWRGPGAEAPRRGAYRPVDNQLFRIPTGTERSGDDPQVPL